jgi:hypothetical protein
MTFLTDVQPIPTVILDTEKQPPHSICQIKVTYLLWR